MLSLSLPRKMVEGLVVLACAFVALAGCTADLQDLDECHAFVHVVCQRRMDCKSETNLSACMSRLSTNCSAVLLAPDIVSCIESTAKLKCVAGRQDVNGCGFAVQIE